jgi:hypothetical protein
VTHPITPPPELVQQWFTDQRGLSEASRQQIATRAAQWGADQELEACCAIARVDPVCGTKHQRNMLVQHIREQRRPKPQTLKEQALDRCNDYIDPDGIIRRALEALPE